jgi:hypothetical protein
MNCVPNWEWFPLSWPPIRCSRSVVMPVRCALYPSLLRAEELQGRKASQPWGTPIGIWELPCPCVYLPLTRPYGMRRGL